MGYGMYTSVDWALANDVLPDKENIAKDLAVWQISFSVPGIVAPLIAGPILDRFQEFGRSVHVYDLGYVVIFSLAVLFYSLSGFLIHFVKKTNVPNEIDKISFFKKK